MYMLKQAVVNVNYNYSLTLQYINLLFIEDKYQIDHNYLTTNS